MARISKRKIREFFRRSDAASKTSEQGKALEDLICYLMECVPGIEVSRRNRLNLHRTQEIDVAFWNSQSRAGFQFLPHLLLVECKNWSKPVTAQEVAYFATRLRKRGCEYGFLIAANGITGTEQELRAAYGEIASALADGIRVIVVTRSEIEELANTEELIRLVKEKLCELTVSGSVFLD